MRQTFTRALPVLGSFAGGCASVMAVGLWLEMLMR
jgi:hypothetical protein